MSDGAGENGQLDPSAVLAAAIERLSADGHVDLAAAVRRVNEYLRDLAAAQTEIALASDRIVERGEALLSAAPATPATPPGLRCADADLRVAEQHGTDRRRSGGDA